MARVESDRARKEVIILGGSGQKTGFRGSPRRRLQGKIYLLCRVKPALYCIPGIVWSLLWYQNWEQSTVVQSKQLAGEVKMGGVVTTIKNPNL